MKTKQQLLAELFTTCLELNDENFTVFFDYSGHVNWVEVRVNMFGYSKSALSDREYILYTDERFNSQASQAVIDQLHQLKAESIAERERLATDKAYQKQKRKEALLKELEELED